jgi:hypothetical protein
MEKVRMATKIERVLFRSLGTHSVKSLCVDQHELKLVVAPWSDLENELEAVFRGWRLHSIFVDWVEESDAPDGLKLPWDIIAVDCKEIADSKWNYLLKCEYVEYCFDGQWPQITVAEHRPTTR